ncbi:hypothetical protein MMC34_008072 [Xylographa carneopallida]|nr:hypothetical protein [Xylographa carneopallida]
MDVLDAYVYSTGSWMVFQALGLLISPKLSIAVLSPESRGPTTVEEYLARALGFSFLTLTVLTVLLTGTVPLRSTNADNVRVDESGSKSLYTVPAVAVTMCFQSIMAFYCYSRYLHMGLSVFALDVALYGSLAAMGLWCLLFATSSGKISRRTGADHRTSGFPFTNMEADKRRVAKKRS